MKQEQVDMKKNQYWSDQSHESPLGMGDPLIHLLYLPAECQLVLFNLGL